MKARLLTPKKAERLRKQAAEVEKSKRTLRIVAFVLIGVVAVIFLFALWQIKKLETHEGAKHTFHENYYPKKNSLNV